MPDTIRNLDRKLALVVDDSKMQCMLLAKLLEEEDYQVIIAHDGACGVAKYVEYQPDLVLMDINMPIMNGYEAAKQIKNLSHGSLAPLIFITSMDSDQAYIDSVNAGGDSILVRPFTPEVFKAKIKALQRISDLYAKVKNLQQEQQLDEELAEQLLTSVIGARNYAQDKIGIVKKAATVFSGDIQLSELCPNGDVHVLLGDFTGHGLRSSIGAIPLAETFRTMSKKGFSLLEITKQINQQLYKLLPTDLFLCASFISVSSQNKTVYTFNAGLPDGYILNKHGEIKNKIGSIHPPIGVMPELLDDVSVNIYPVEHSDRILLISDGVIEARNNEQEMYGIERLEQTVRACDFSQNIAVLVMNSVNEFCQNAPQDDDISIIDVPCDLSYESKKNNSLINTNNDEDREYSIDEDKLSEANKLTKKQFALVHEQNIQPVWQWQLSLFGERLAKVNPIPLAMNQIQAIEGAGEHWQSLYTILTELFINALDHGVLELSSALKNSPQGFVHYFNEREQKLQQLTYGAVDISLAYYLLAAGGKVVIQIKDSGKGFNIFETFKENSLAVAKNKKLCGRGLELVSQLTDSLEYKDNGSLVIASYIWKKNNN